VRDGVVGGRPVDCPFDFCSSFLRRKSVVDSEELAVPAKLGSELSSEEIYRKAEERAGIVRKEDDGYPLLSRFPLVRGSKSKGAVDTAQSSSRKT